MIFYGTKSGHLKSERVSGTICKHCQNQAPTNISIYGKYAYIYWIPLFPMGKTGVSECSHCKITLAPRDMDESLKRKYNEVKSKTKTPIWHWSLLIAAIAFIGFAIFMANSHKKDVVAYIKNPQVGDIYDYKPNDFYSTLKVTAVTNDSIFITPNNYEIEKKSRLYKIDKPENYTGTPYAIGRNELENLYKSKKILDIDRD